MTYETGYAVVYETSYYLPFKSQTLGLFSHSRQNLMLQKNVKEMTY